jgi:hypothetical protein
MGAKKIMVVGDLLAIIHYMVNRSLPNGAHLGRIVFRTQRLMEGFEIA